MKKRKRRFLGALAVCTMLAAGTTSAAVYQYKFKISSASVGYNTDNPGWKLPGYGHCGISVDKIDNNLWDTGKKRVTNFIVIAADSTQITENVAIAGGKSDSVRFYSADHQGQVYLRGNSTHTGVGYTVSGTWNPNCN